MRKNTLILITVVYFSLSLLFNYSLYPLLITNEYSDQYFLIFIYFLSEIFSFFFLIFSKKNEKKLVSTFGPILGVEESVNFSTLSETYNNMTTSINISDTIISAMQPFIGMKWPSFFFPALFDFLSKFFIFNGLKILENDIILRAIVELLLVFSFSKILLQSTYNRFSLVGSIIIFLGLIFVCFYCQISKNIKLYFEYNNYSTIGMLLCIVGEIFASIQIFFQVKYIRIGEKHSCREIAWEGVFGLIISYFFFQFSLWFPMYASNYSENEKLSKKFWYCLKDERYSAIPYLFTNIKNNIIWYFIFFLVCILYNLTGTIISKYIGEVYRSSINVGRFALIIFLVLFIHNGDNIGVLNCIISVIFSLSIFIGLFLAIILRKQKDILFGDRGSLADIDLKDDLDNQNNNDENNNNH
jgi:hypothetical protein